MEKGKVFISSTIYDFRDLRSALKYWLTELGYDVYESEEVDFPRDSAQNSYKTCLSTIEKCDWFILLIGSRVGGKLYDEDTQETISITRKEYRKAYELFLKGKIKKIITFIRDEVWQERETRKNLSKELEDSLDVLSISTKSIKEPEHVFSFIDEVRRTLDIKQGTSQIDSLPKGNWVNIFQNFSDIITTLNIELNINGSISDLVWKTNLRREYLKNLKKLLSKNQSGVFPYYRVMTPIREKCVKLLQDNQKHPITISIDELNFLCITIISGDTFNCAILKNAILSGFFFDYNAETNTYESGSYDHYADVLLETIEANNNTEKYFWDSQKRLHNKLEVSKKNPQKDVVLTYDEIAFILSLHDRLHNIKEITLYLISKIDGKEPIRSPQLYPLRFSDNFIPNIPSIYKEIFGDEMTIRDIETYLSNN